MSRDTAVAAARAVVPAGLAVAGFLLITMVSARPVGYAVVCAALVAAAVGTVRPAPGAQWGARLVAAAAVLTLTGLELPDGGTADTSTYLLFGGVVLFGVLLAEPLLHRLARPWYAARGLPVAPGWAAAAVTNGMVWLVDSAAVALVGLVAVLAAPAWLVPLPALAAGVLFAAVTAEGMLRRRSGHRAELAALREAVRRHEPRFLLYFSAPPGSEYQVTMWLPHLQRLGEPFLVVLAEEHHLPVISRVADAPVVAHHTFEALDAAVVPSVRAVFYVNNGMKNTHCVRLPHLTHIQLYHGDSDKAVTASPLNAMYDKVFVAGQAAVDRFANYGVDLPREKFVLVGRPQVAALATAQQPIGEIADPTVLYAPTWAGAHADSNYCSLPVAETIVHGLLNRGVRVILRPHPYAAADRRTAEHLRRVEQLLARDRASTNRQHRWGAAATEPSLFACMDEADAMICDVSAVASDFLYTGKPLAITDMVGAGAAFADTFPVARAAYVLHRDAGNLPGLLDDLLRHDPLAATRQKLRTYYLGDAPPDRYADVFVEQARRWI